MNIVTIQNLCYYLEELGIVDKKSITPFLSLYSKTINYYLNINDSNDSNGFNGNLESNILIFENVLCSYLRKIFNIDKNYKTFSHKIIEKFKQNILIKQYKGLFLLFYIISIRTKYSVIRSFYNIKQYVFNKDESITSRNQNNFPFKKDNNVYYEKDSTNEVLSNNYINEDINNYKNNIFINRINENGNGAINVNHENNFKMNKNTILRNESQLNIYNKKSKSLNNSINRLKKIIIRQRNNKTQNRIHKRVKSSNYNNIQFENKKNQFLSRIKKEHNINFKKKEVLNNTNISKINQNKNKENQNINYIDYNIPKSNDDSYNINDFDIEQNDSEIYKKLNILTPSYYHNNYNNQFDIYHLNKSKSTLENNRSNHSVKYVKKEFYNDDDYDCYNDEEKSSNKSKQYLKNGNLVLNQNYIGMNNLKYIYKYNNKNSRNNLDDNIGDEYYIKFGNKIDIDVLTSNESII